MLGTCRYMYKVWGNLSWVGHGVAPLSSLGVLFSEGTRQSPSPKEGSLYGHSPKHEGKLYLKINELINK